MVYGSQLINERKLKLNVDKTNPVIPSKRNYKKYLNINIEIWYTIKSYGH